MLNNIDILQNYDKQFHKTMIFIILLIVLAIVTKNWTIWNKNVVLSLFLL